MKKIIKNARHLGWVFLLTGALGTAACSTGTSKGDTNVEESDYKDKNPEEANMRQEGSTPASDSMRSTDKPDSSKIYQKVDPDNGARDADNDGMVDQ
jgi:hypothetical protein